MKKLYIFNFDLVFTKTKTNVIARSADEQKSDYIQQNLRNPSELKKILHQINTLGHKIFVYAHWNFIPGHEYTQGKDLVFLYLEELLGEGNFLTHKNIYATGNTDIITNLEAITLKFSKQNLRDAILKSDLRRACFIDYNADSLNKVKAAGYPTICVNDSDSTLEYLEAIELDLKSAGDAHAKAFLKYMSQRDATWRRHKGLMSISLPLISGFCVAFIMLALAATGVIPPAFSNRVYFLLGLAIGGGPVGLLFAAAYIYSSCKKPTFFLQMGPVSKLGNSFYKLSQSLLKNKEPEQDLLLEDTRQKSYGANAPVKSVQTYYLVKQGEKPLWHKEATVTIPEEIQVVNPYANQV